MSRLGTVNAIPKRPYWPSSRIPATTMTPTAEIIEDTATPQKRLNPPLVEVLAILKASLSGILLLELPNLSAILDGVGYLVCLMRLVFEYYSKGDGFWVV